MLVVEKQFIESFHDDNKLAGKLVVLKRRIKLLIEANDRVIKDSKPTVLMDIMDVVSTGNLIDRYLTKRLTNGTRIYHYDKGPHCQTEKLNKQHYATLNKAFKTSEWLISLFKLGSKLTDIYRK
jgi:hypothetical protein